MFASWITTSFSMLGDILGYQPWWNATLQAPDESRGWDETGSKPSAAHFAGTVRFTLRGWGSQWPCPTFLRFANLQLKMQAATCKCLEALNITMSLFMYWYASWTWPKYHASWMLVVFLLITDFKRCSPASSCKAREAGIQFSLEIKEWISK